MRNENSHSNENENLLEVGLVEEQVTKNVELAFLILGFGGVTSAVGCTVGLCSRPYVRLCRRA
jgi:hypothetical protein